MTGILLKREIVAPTRKPSTFVIRGIYGLILVAAFGIIALIYFIASLAEEEGWKTITTLSLLAQWFVNSIVTINLFACLVFTPAYMASAIAQEKDSGTMQDLLLTTMSSSEIVLSKFAGRLFQVAMALLAGLPMFAVARLLGGFDGSMMIALAAMTVLWLVTSGAFTMFVSVLVRRTRDAVLGTYALGMMLILILSLRHFYLPANWLPYTDLLDAFNPLFVLQPAWTGGTPGDLTRRILETSIVLLSFSAILLTLSVRFVRPFGVRQLEVRGARRLWGGERSARSVDDRPMLWKERYFPPAGRVALILRRSGVAAVIGMVILTAWLWYQTFTTGLNTLGVIEWLQWLDLMAWPIYLSLLMTSSSAISGERERHTWDAILTTPLEGREILLGKVWGTIWDARWWLLAMALLTAQALGIAISTANINLFGLPQGNLAASRVVGVLMVFGKLIELSGGLLFLLGLGLRTSLSCQTSGKSLAITLGLWISAGFAVGIAVVGIGVLGVVAVLVWTRWLEAGTPAWIAPLAAGTFVTHLIWLLPMLGGLFWGAVGVGLIVWSTRIFDELAVRTGFSHIATLDRAKEMPPGEGPAATNPQQITAE